MIAALLRSVFAAANVRELYTFAEATSLEKENAFDIQLYANTLNLTHLLLDLLNEYVKVTYMFKFHVAAFNMWQGGLKLHVSDDDLAENLGVINFTNGTAQLTQPNRVYLSRVNSAYMLARELNKDRLVVEGLAGFGSLYAGSSDGVTSMNLVRAALTQISVVALSLAEDERIFDAWVATNRKTAHTADELDQLLAALKMSLA